MDQTNETDEFEIIDETPAEEETPESDDVQEEDSGEVFDDDTPSQEEIVADVEKAKEPEKIPVQDDPMDDIKDCQVIVSIALLPDDGDPRGRQVIAGVRTHGEAPILHFYRDDRPPYGTIVRNLIDEAAANLKNIKLTREEREEKERKAKEEAAERAAQRAADSAARLAKKTQPKEPDVDLNKVAEEMLQFDLF